MTDLGVATLRSWRRSCSAPWPPLGRCLRLARSRHRAARRLEVWDLPLHHRLRRLCPAPVLRRLPSLLRLCPRRMRRRHRLLHLRHRRRLCPSLEPRPLLRHHRRLCLHLVPLRHLHPPEPDRRRRRRLLLVVRPLPQLPVDARLASLARSSQENH